MWGGVDSNDALTAVILYVGRWFLGIIGFLLIAWAAVHFMKNLGLAWLGKTIKTGMGEMKFSSYVIIFIVGIICIGAILGGSFMNLLDKLYLFLLHLKSQMNL